MTTQEIQRHARALSGLPADHPAWLAVLAVIAHEREEAVDLVKPAMTPPDKRAHAAGAIEQLDSLRDDLMDLRSGAWKSWPGVQGHIEAQEPNEQAD